MAQARKYDTNDRKVQVHDDRRTPAKKSGGTAAFVIGAIVILLVLGFWFGWFG